MRGEDHVSVEGPGKQTPTLGGVDRVKQLCAPLLRRELVSYNGDWGELPGIRGEGWFRPALAYDPFCYGSGPLTSARLSLPTLRAGPPCPQEGGRIVQSWCPSHHPWCRVPGRWSWLTTRRWWERGWRQHGVCGCPCADDPEGTGSVKSPGSIRSSGVGGRGEAPEGKSLHISAKETLAFSPLVPSMLVLGCGGLGR